MENFRKRMSIKYGQGRIDRELERHDPVIDMAPDAPLNSFGAEEKTNPLDNEVGAL